MIMTSSGIKIKQKWIITINHHYLAKFVSGKINDKIMSIRS